MRLGTELRIPSACFRSSASMLDPSESSSSVSPCRQLSSSDSRLNSGSDHFSFSRLQRTALVSSEPLSIYRKRQIIKHGKYPMYAVSQLLVRCFPWSLFLPALIRDTFDLFPAFISRGFVTNRCLDISTCGSLQNLLLEQFLMRSRWEDASNPFGLFDREFGPEVCYSLLGWWRRFSFSRSTTRRGGRVAHDWQGSDDQARVGLGKQE